MPGHGNESPPDDLAYARALQYWMERADLPVSGGPCPLARCVRELRQHVGRHVTCNKQDILDRLRDIPSEDEEGKTPSVDPSMPMDVGDAWPCPAQTPLEEELTRPANKGEGKEQV